VVHVPYRGLNPAMNDLVAGHVDFLVTSVIGVLPYVNDGSVRALATFDAARAEQLPDVPTTAELGFPGLTLSNWYGLLAPAAVPAETRARLEQAFVGVIRSKELEPVLKESGVVGGGAAADFERLLKAEFARWPGLLAKLGISGT
jgi:tripartite-type tricarboxylate transporter receptor subunit TctC